MVTFDQRQAKGSALISELTRQGSLDTEAIFAELKKGALRSVSPSELTRTFEEACDAAARAYTPYINPNRASGVAILGSDGQVVSGTRVENACTNLTLDDVVAGMWRLAFKRVPEPLLIARFRLGDGFDHSQGKLLHGACGEALQSLASGALAVEFDRHGIVEMGRVGAPIGKGINWQTPRFELDGIPDTETILDTLNRSYPGILNANEVMRLRDSAISAANRAVAPYSSFPVGSSILTHKGEVYTGANIEVENTLLSSCAERNAIGAMVSRGALLGSQFGDEIVKAVMVFIPNLAEVATPCGGCRQVLYEFGPSALVISINQSSDMRIGTVRELLPHGFGPSTMIAAKMSPKSP